MNAGGSQRGHQFFAPTLVRAAEQANHRCANGAHLLGRKHAIRPGLEYAFLHLPLQPGHTHHEELVHIGANEGQEHQALEQRIAVVLRLFQHAPLEVDEAELAIDVERGIVKRSRRLRAVAPLRRGCGGSGQTSALD